MVDSDFLISLANQVELRFRMMIIAKNIDDLDLGKTNDEIF